MTPQPLAHRRTCAFTGIERLSRGLVGNQSDAHHETLLPDLANMRQLFQRFQQLRQCVGFDLHLANQIVFLEQIQRRKRGGACQWISGVGVTVEKCFCKVS